MSLQDEDFRLQDLDAFEKVEEVLRHKDFLLEFEAQEKQWADKLVWSDDL